jgi:hypothetical protein
MAIFKEPWDEHPGEIFKGYQLQLYEVIYYGGACDPEGADGRDAIYLVAARSMEEARSLVDRNGTHGGRGAGPLVADVVQEIGIGSLADQEARILRGPYFAFGYQFSAKIWHREEMDG